MINELKEGRGPLYMATDVALNAFLDDRKAAGMNDKDLKKFWKHLESEAWEDFLDMSVGQAGLWAGMNVEPEKTGSEIMPTEPYMLGFSLRLLWYLDLRPERRLGSDYQQSIPRPSI